MIKTPFLALFAFFITTNTWAKVTAIPENDMSIPALRVKDFEGVTEHDFNVVTTTLFKLYAPVVKEKSNVELVMNADWKDATVNAFASREVGTWTIHVAGGIARAKGMTKDALALIVCHEIGHQLGGAPRTFLYDGWPSAEGQADYWASSKCLKKYYYELRNEEVRLDTSIPEKLINQCSVVYKTYTDIKICARTMMASVDFAQFLNELPDVRIPIDLEGFDTREVKGTNTNNYPRPQCRFDTLSQGALCDIAFDIATSETDAKIGHCNEITRPGTRPRCWYKPKD